MAKDCLGCCGWGPTSTLGSIDDPTKTLGCTDDPGAKLKPVGFVGDKIVGLRYKASPQCGKVPGNSFGMTRAEFIAFTTELGHRVDPVEALQGRLEDAGLYEYALTEPTG